MLLAYQDREEGRNGSPFCACCKVLMLPREPDQDRGTEALHHPTKRGTQQDQLPRWCRGAGVLPMLPANQERKPTRKEGRQRKKGKAKKRSDNKPTKKGTPPPIARGRKHLPSSQIRAKKSAKSRLGVVLKKFSEKFFVGMFRGKEKPLALSQRKGFEQMKIVK